MSHVPPGCQLSFNNSEKWLKIKEPLCEIIDRNPHGGMHQDSSDRLISCSVEWEEV
jgi:hypothetical protein